MKIPLFPLNTVLFPESELQLRLFEPRYLDMVSECSSKKTGFGICLIRNSNESDSHADFFSMGTYVNIIDWNQTQDNLLSITVKGEKRFKVQHSELRSNNLRIGEISWLSENNDNDTVPDSYQGFCNLLKEVARQYELSLINETERFKQASWVSNRLAELMPFEMSAKQKLLEMDNAFSRFDYMQCLLEKIIFDE